jgi:hypothetical protein
MDGIYTAKQFGRVAKELVGFHTFEYVCVNGRYTFKVFDGKRRLTSRFSRPSIESHGFVSMFDGEVAGLMPDDSSPIRDDNDYIKIILKEK